MSAMDTNFQTNEEAAHWSRCQARLLPLLLDKPLRLPAGPLTLREARALTVEEAKKATVEAFEMASLLADLALQKYRERNRKAG